jgi:1-hydroxycarotenoid 3,4-desaturase
VAESTVVVIGAGIGGLVCAIDLAAQGLAVTVIEKERHAGGKLRETALGDARIDSGPTVFTMRWVFDALFADAGASFDDHVRVQRLNILARHAWSANERFDLFADVAHSAQAVGEFSGAAEARRFLAFCDEAKTIYRTLKQPFLAAPRPNPLSLSHRIGLHRPASLFAIKPFATLWSELSRHFHDPRLRQLFGRYATYSGSSPFLSPATLMLIAHVEQDGVWTIEGGMQRLADALETLAHARGVRFRFEARATRILLRAGRVERVQMASGEELKADAVVVNADTQALACGLFGGDVARAVKPMQAADRSLSAVTWAMSARAEGFPLLRHNVFFSRDYRAEFDQIFTDQRLPGAPSIYVCAQDRGDAPEARENERLLLLVNAPPDGDRRIYKPEEIEQCRTRIFAHLERCGLRLQPIRAQVTTPTDFHRLFPATGGALYGRASHGWMASFQRPGSATPIQGLYLAGGSTHPGAGVPMAALSGRLAARRLLSNRASMRSSHRAATSGGISMGSAATGATPSP